MTHTLKPDEIWRRAQLLVKQEGENAPVCAARRAQQHLEAGEQAARRDWMRTMVAAKTLLLFEAVAD